MDAYKEYDKGDLLNGRYSKIADISEGSYGLVSVAKDVQNNDALVAVKFIYPLDYKSPPKEQGSRPSSSPAKLRSPVRSSKRNKNSILQSLYEEALKEISVHTILGKHPNIASLNDHFDSFLILEYCSRGDLYEAIQNGQGPSTSQDIKDVFQQILSAVEYCHNLNVFHRDLKPENILISDDWSIKLCDWGLATTEKIITNRNEFDVGSERYMAPELFDSNIKSYDASKIDIWSIGIILLTLVFHKNPFNVANYSDKRFIQFSNNREALFDFFSTMSGEMFSVLRFCLNLDPDNRHIQNLKDELKTLKYFTIDEEYWASDYEEDMDGDVDDEFEFFNDEDDYYYKKSQNSISVSPVKQEGLIAKPELEVKPLVDDTNLEASPPSTTESDTTNTKSNFSKTSNHSDETSIPHNHRADALLSSNTDLKPIPIGGSNVKFVRNTRKPFNVASYNHSSSSKMGNNHNSKFNREDFFTPKSVFNHYMVKYGEQRQSNAGKGQSSGANHWKKKHRNRFWKNRRGNLNTQYRGKQNGRNGNVENTQNGYNFPRKKSNSFSTSKSRKFIVNGNGSTPYSLNQSHVSSNSLQAPSTIPSTAPLSGKYVPPFLRSPNNNKSPLVGPLVEEIDRLALDDDDEVFHLEGDFDGNTHSSNNDSHIGSDHNHYGNSIKTSTINLSNDNVFKKPQTKASNSGISHSQLFANENSNDPSSRSNVKDMSAYSGNSGHFRRHSATFASVDRPVSSGSYHFNEDCSKPGKYIPPFRRGSCTSRGNGLAPILKAKPEKKKLENSHNHFEDEKLQSLTSSSVPTNDMDWSWFKKDWSDYDA